MVNAGKYTIHGPYGVCFQLTTHYKKNLAIFGDSTSSLPESARSTPSAGGKATKHLDFGQGKDWS